MLYKRLFFFLSMVLGTVIVDGFQSTLALLIVLLATSAAVAGIVVLEIFFRNKLKELFSDVNYFIFFFLVSGYLLYSVGEVSFYLTSVIFGDESPMGIADVYWSAGALLVLVSFIALAVVLFRQYYDRTKLRIMVVIGGVLLALTLILVFGVTLHDGAYFFGYFYPIVSSLIVAFALCVILFSSQLGNFSTALSFFFLASCGILLGDIFFTFITAKGTYGFAGLITDIFYLLGYGLSFIAFIILRRGMSTTMLQK